jgi:hypothetical protein
MVCERGSNPWSVRSEWLKADDGLGISTVEGAKTRIDVRNQTATSDFGHSCARVPEWLHIGAYPHAFPDRSRLQSRYEAPANEPIRCLRALEGHLIAMQKVVGSNPISRFFTCK